MDPFTIILIGSLVVSAGGVVASIIKGSGESDAADAALEQSRANAELAAKNAERQAKAAERDAAIEERNAEILAQQSRDSILRGEAATIPMSMDAARLVGAQRSAAASSGLDVTSESVVATVAGSAQLAALDIATVRNNAARESWGLMQESKQHKTAAQYIREGKTDMLAYSKAEQANILQQGRYAYQAGKDSATATYLGGAMQGGASVLNSVGQYGVAKGWGK